MRIVAALLAVAILQTNQQAISLIEQALALLKGTQTSVITVPAGGDLQAALNAAKPGDRIVLPIGTTFTGNYTLPEKLGSNLPITLTSSSVMAAGERVSPTDALAKLRSPNNEAVIKTAARAHHWTIQRLEISSAAGDIVTLGDGSPVQHTLADIPHDLVLDQVYIHGDQTTGAKRGVYLNSASTSIVNSYISDVKLVGQDNQGIGGLNGPGPYTIANNYLEASGENIMFGGGDPSIGGLIPSDITIRGNYIAKPLNQKGSSWQVKNLLELKNALRVLIEGNVFEHNWAGQGQSGYAIVFTPRNQNGACLWCRVGNVTFQRNVVRDSDQGMNITGQDDEQRSMTTGPVTIVDNLFDVIRGHWLLLTNGPISQLTIARNTARQTGNILELAGASSPSPIIRGNLVAYGSYGVHGDNRAIGKDSLDFYLPGSTFTQNTIVNAPDPKVFPAGNTFPATWPAVGGVDPLLLPDVAKVMSGR